MTKTKLVDQLRTETEKIVSERKRSAAEAERVRLAKISEEAQILADEIIAKLPKQMKDAAKKGEGSIQVKFRETGPFTWNQVENSAAWRIESWARAQGLYPNISHIDGWPDGPDVDYLTISWMK